MALPGWSGKESGVYVILPLSRLLPTKPRLFVGVVARAIKAD
jgi:hypothetical protein